MKQRTYQQTVSELTRARQHVEELHIKLNTIQGELSRALMEEAIALQEYQKLIK
jgi:hypothetical protein